MPVSPSHGAAANDVTFLLAMKLTSHFKTNANRTFTRAVYLLGFRNLRGGDGIRTHCLYIANVALYQLSYTPEEAPTLAQRPPRL
jgi:hypothetical protein